MSRTAPYAKFLDDDDILYVRLRDKPIARTREINGDVWRNVDYAEDGSVVALEFVDASIRFSPEGVPELPRVVRLLREANLTPELLGLITLSAIIVATAETLEQRSQAGVYAAYDPDSDHLDVWIGDRQQRGEHVHHEPFQIRFDPDTLELIGFRLLNASVAADASGTATEFSASLHRLLAELRTDRSRMVERVSGSIVGQALRELAPV